MDRNKLIAVITCAVVVGLLIAWHTFAPMFADNARKQAASQAVNSAFKDSLQKAVDEVGRKEAGRIADEIVKDMANQPVPLERADYKMVLPPWSSVDPPDPNMGPDRMATIDLVPRGTMIIVLVPNKTDGAKSFDKLNKAIRDRMTFPSDAAPQAFEKVTVARSAATVGIIENEKVTFEIAQIDGNSKGLIVQLIYRDNTRAATIEKAAKALATLSFKE